MDKKTIFLTLYLLYICHVHAEDGDIIMNDEDDEDIK